VEIQPFGYRTIQQTIEAEESDLSQEFSAAPLE
jgi:hypothetical protein